MSLPSCLTIDTTELNMLYFHLASININSQTSVAEVQKGSGVQLKWQISTTSGDTYTSGTIKLQRPGKQEINIALSVSEFKIIMYSPYSTRRWSATHVKNSQEVVLDIKNAEEDDDGDYVLDMHYISSGQPKSS